MSLSVWKHGVPDVDPAYVGFDGNRYGARDNRVIEDEDTGHLFVPLDEQTTQEAAKLVAAARDTALEGQVRELMRCLAPNVNGSTANSWMAAVGYSYEERMRHELGLSG